MTCSADPSKSAFQLARKRLASIRASQRSGEEEDDVELYPGVQDLISGTLQSGRNTAHQVCNFAAELSKGSTILRSLFCASFSSCHDKCLLCHAALSFMLLVDATLLVSHSLTQAPIDHEACLLCILA